MAIDPSEQIQPVEENKRPGCLITTLLLSAIFPLWGGFLVITMAVADPQASWLLIITLLPGILFLYYAIKLWRHPSVKLPLGCSEVSLVAVQLLLLFCIVETVPSVLSAIPRGKQRKTMGDMYNIGQALESYESDHHQYPLTDFHGLSAALSPKYLFEIPKLDGWKHEYRYETLNGASDYILRSAGADGAFEHSNGMDYTQCDTMTFASDVVMKDGQFIRAPSGKQMRGDSIPDSGCSH